jgi:tripartite-type tricarboxylate transporter receptor subunit TctC
MGRGHRVIFAALAACAGQVHAQTEANYPLKPARIVVPVTPGGSTDILARLVAQRLSEVWRVQFIVENRPGAGGVVGVDYVAKSASDGYTLVMGYIGTFAFMPAVVPKIPYDAVRDFAPIVRVANVPNMLAIHPSVPAKTVKELIAVAKARPGQLNYGSAGNGSNSHVSVEFFKQLTGTDIQQISYKGAGSTMVDLLGGHISLTIVGVPPLLPHVRSARVRALGVAAPQRLAILPNVPTIAEAGVPGYDVTQWYGLMAPANTPSEIVRKLNAEVRRYLQLPDAAARMAGEGAIPAGNTPEQFHDLIKSESARWATVLKKAGI